MKKLIIRLFTIGILLSGLQACDFDFDMIEYVDDKQLDDQGNKLVINGFISPEDTLIRIEVTRSKPVIGVRTYHDYDYDPNQENDNPYDLDFVKNAKVILSDGEREVQLNYKEETILSAPSSYHYAEANPHTYSRQSTVIVGPYPGGQSKKYLKTYQISSEEFPIEAGKTYTVTVQTPEGEEVSASCTVPVAVALTNSQTQGVDYRYEDCLECPADKKTQISFSFEDRSGEANYYRMILETFTYTASYRVDSIYHDFNTNKEFIEEEALFTDSYFNGQNIEKKLIAHSIPYWTEERKKNYAEQYPYGVKIVQEGTIHLLHVDDHYYKYHESLNRHSDVGDENPFAEPVPVYTNVLNGYGIFSAYNRTKKTVTIVDFNANIPQ
jgi:hypothetical protein